MRRVMMMSRSFVALTLVGAAACTTAAPAGTDSHDSVRERLADGPTRLSVGGAESTGTVTARRWTPGGWVEGDTALVIENGELIASLDGSGTLSLDAFSVGIAPIEIPEEVFKKPAQLSDVRVKLAERATGAVTWTSDDEATATLTVALDLDWAIAVNGGKTPLGSQHLPPIEVALSLGGDGSFVVANVDLVASGELWSWAGLLEMTRLELGLSASTVD